MRRVAAFFYYSSILISNYINARKDVQYLPDLVVEYQKLILIEEIVLKDYIYNYF